MATPFKLLNIVVHAKPQELVHDQHALMVFPAVSVVTLDSRKLQKIMDDFCSIEGLPSVWENWLECRRVWCAYHGAVLYQCPDISNAHEIGNMGEYAHLQGKSFILLETV